MSTRGSTLSRRGLMLAGVGAVAVGIGLGRPQRTLARPMLLRGVTGGGMIEIEDSDGAIAHLSLFASVMQVPDAEAELFVGSVQWVENDGLQLAATEITACIVTPEREDGREVRGSMSVNGAGSYPFVLRIIDAGPPGLGLDHVSLEVGGAIASEDATPSVRRIGFSYAAAGPVIAGDFENLSVDVDVPDPVE